MTSDGSQWYSQQHGSQALTGDPDPILLDLSMFSGRFLPGEYSRTESQSPLDERTTSPPRTISLAQLQQLIGAWGPRLVEAFEQTAHPTFPLGGNDVFSAYHSGMADLDPALVAAMYLIGRAFVPREGVFDYPLPDADQLEDAALSLFQLSLSRPTLSTVHAGVLLMQHVGMDTKTLNTQVVGASYELGLHLDCSSLELSRQEMGRRKRLAWAVYMQDKWCSLIHGRPSSISANNWGVLGLVESDFDVRHDVNAERSAALEAGYLVFTQMVSLTQILSTILETFYTLQAVQELQTAAETGQHLILERAKPIQIRLKQWFAQLPPILKIDHTTSSSTFTSAGMYSGHAASLTSQATFISATLPPKSRCIEVSFVALDFLLPMPIWPPQDSRIVSISVVPRPKLVSFRPSILRIGCDRLTSMLSGTFRRARVLLW